ncbi:hypothetical protein M2145_002916 [Lachnospiraceae bacterium PF1-21]
MSRQSFRLLEYKDAASIISYLQSNEVYDKDEFLFAVDIDILNTTELDIRNSLFKYQMLGAATFSDKNQIDNVLLFQSSTQLKQNSLVRLELLTLKSEEFVYDAMKYMMECLKDRGIKKVKVIVMRQQVTERVEEILNMFSATKEATYSAKDGDLMRDSIAYGIAL